MKESCPTRGSGGKFLEFEGASEINIWREWKVKSLETKRGRILGLGLEIGGVVKG